MQLAKTLVKTERVGNRVYKTWSMKFLVCKDENGNSKHGVGLTDSNKHLVGTPCGQCGATMEEKEDFTRGYSTLCCKCKDESKENETEERFSLGITCGHYCNDCWDKAPYRKEGREGYSFDDAGEYYDEDDY